jgi:hypothetical protein
MLPFIHRRGGNGRHSGKPLFPSRQTARHQVESVGHAAGCHTDLQGPRSSPQDQDDVVNAVDMASQPS